MTEERRQQTVAAAAAVVEALQADGRFTDPEVQVGDADEQPIVAVILGHQLVLLTVELDAAS